MTTLLAAPAAAFCALILGIALAAQASGTLDAPAQAVITSCAAVPAQGTAAALNASQAGDAKIIYDVSASLQLP
jgi:hypothetical protein